MVPAGQSTHTALPGSGWYSAHEMLKESGVVPWQHSRGEGVPGVGFQSVGARPVHPIITMIKWIRSSCLSVGLTHMVLARVPCENVIGIWPYFLHLAAVDRIWQALDSQGQMLAFAFRVKVLKTFLVVPSSLHIVLRPVQVFNRGGEREREFSINNLLVRIYFFIEMI